MHRGQVLVLLFSMARGAHARNRLAPLDARFRHVLVRHLGEGLMAVDALQDFSVHARREMILVDEQGAQLTAGTRRRKTGIAVAAQANVVVGRRGGRLRDRLANSRRHGEGENDRGHACGESGNRHPIYVLVDARRHPRRTGAPPFLASTRRSRSTPTSLSPSQDAIELDGAL